MRVKPDGEHYRKTVFFLVHFLPIPKKEGMGTLARRVPLLHVLPISRSLTFSLDEGRERGGGMCWTIGTKETSSVGFL